MGSGLAILNRNALRLELTCELTQVRPTAQAVRRFLADNGCEESEAIDCELALVEACNNAVEHCEESGRSQPVFVEILCDAQCTEMRVTDHTPGFDWPDRVSLPSPDSESGRGLFLIQSVMDYAGYFRGRGENILVVRKNKAPWGIHPISPRRSTP